MTILITTRIFLSKYCPFFQLYYDLKGCVEYGPWWPWSWKVKVANFLNEAFPCSCNFNFRLFRYGLLNILSRSELTNYFSFHLPQIDPTFSSRPPDQTTSWIQITRLDQTRPDQTMCFRQTIWRDRLCQTTLDQLSFLPQTTQPGQHSLSVSFTLPQYIQPLPSGCHYQLLVTGKVHSLCVGSWEVNM